MAYHSVYDLYDMIADAMNARHAEWRQSAACVGTNVDGGGVHFSSPKDPGVEEAKALCRACPVIGECKREYDKLPPAMRRHGVWAGKHGEEWQGW